MFGGPPLVVGLLAWLRHLVLTLSRGFLKTWPWLIHFHHCPFLPSGFINHVFSLGVFLSTDLLFSSLSPSYRNDVGGHRFTMDSTSTVVFFVTIYTGNGLDVGMGY